MIEQQVKIFDDLLIINDEESLKDSLLFTQLSTAVNFLAQHDFHRLISLLYRVDVSEKKLMTILKEHREVDAGNIIARLLIDRQIEKIQARKKYSTRGNALDGGEERW